MPNSFAVVGFYRAPCWTEFERNCLGSEIGINKFLKFFNAFHLSVNLMSYFCHIQIFHLKNDMSIKPISASILLVLSNIYIQAQVGIGTSSPASSAKLEIYSTTQGFLPPRMTSTQRGQITNPAIGLVVYQTDGASGLYHYNGTTWKQLAPVEVDNTYKLVSTGVASVIAISQDIATANPATNPAIIVPLTNSSITVTVPAGFTDVRIILQWNVWGDVVATTNAAGSIRYQIVQTGQSSATYSSVMMTSWNALNGTAWWATPAEAMTRYAAPVSYILTNPAAGTYTFSLGMNRETEAGTITQFKNWGVSGTGQVFVR